jgi:hypothetical protein
MIATPTAFATRVLPPAEWSRLQGTELDGVTAHLPPTAQIVVVEQDGAIVACWAAFNVLHVEGIWIAPAHRRSGSVARRLLRAMRQVVASFGCRSAMTAALTDEVDGFITRLGGTRVPGTHFLLPFEGDRICPLE